MHVCGYACVYMYVMLRGKRIDFLTNILFLRKGTELAGLLDLSFYNG